jgi:protocatechuate 3,4-dioxygenase beta subunit
MRKRGLTLRLRFLTACLIAAPLFAALAAQQPREPTPQTSLGPEYQPDSPNATRLWQQGDPGQRLHLQGRVLATSGRPVAGAQVQMWQADGAGEYHDRRYRAALETGADGGFRLTTALPGQYWGAKHIHVVVTHPGHQPLQTRILFKGDPHVNEAAYGDLAILLEEVHKDDETVLVGGVEFVMQPIAGE